MPCARFLTDSRTRITIRRNLKGRMKINLSKILGVGLTVALLASSIVIAPAPKPAVAGTLEWSALSLPGAPGNKTRGISSRQSVFAISPDGSTIFASNSGNGTVYRSTNGGSTFSQTAGTGTPGWNDGVVAVSSSTFGVFVKSAANVRITAIGVSPTFALDKTVVVATAAMSGVLPNAGLYKSTDGGANFSQLSANVTTGEYITGVALSPTYATDGLLVASTAAVVPGGAIIGVTWTGGTATTGNVYQFGKTGTFGLNAVSSTAPARDFYDVAFSPNYAADRTIIAVGADGVNTAVLANVNWGATWGSFTGMTDAGAVLGGTTNATLGRASLALPSDFQGFDAAKRVVYLSITTNGTSTASNITRTSFGANTATSATIFPASEGQIHAINYRGTTAAGTLFAGAHASNGVWRVVNPTSSTEFSNWVATDKLPSGSANVTVLAAPDFATSKKVYALTGGLNSALSVSTDSGAVFTDYSLINTSLHIIRDFVPSPNYNADKIIYMVTTANSSGASTFTSDNGDRVSVWHSADGGSSWHRYHSFDASGSGVADAIVRLSPSFATDKTVIVAERGVAAAGNSRIWKSTNSGITWTQLLSSMTTLNDVVVEDGNTFYEAGKGTPSGGTSPVSTVLKSVGGADFSVAPTFSASLSADPFSLARASNGDILVGGSDGRVYRSTDKGLTYSSLPSTTTVTGITSAATAGADVRVVPDSAYATNKIIYAVSTGAAVVGENAASSSGGQVQRLIAGTSTAWEAITDVGTHTTFGPYSGIAVSGNGILYLSDSENATAANADGAIIRSANPSGRTTSLVTLPKFERVGTGDGLTTANVTIRDQFFVGLAVATGNATTGNTVFAIEQAISDPSNVTPSVIPGSPSNVIKDAWRVMTYTDIFNVSPVQTAPAANAAITNTKGVDQQVTLTWRAMTVAGALVAKYQVDLDTTNTFDSAEVPAVTFPLGDNSKTSIKVSGLEGGKQYFWRVRAVEPLYSQWSAARSFTFGLSSPGVGISDKVMVPASGATAVSIDPIFNWPEVTDATYEFQIGEDPTFGILLYAATSPINTHKARETLAYNTTYYWRVRAVTAAAKSAWTTAIFTTMAKPTPPAPPVTITPPAPAPAPEVVKVEVPVLVQQPIPSYLLWAVIIIGAVLIVAVIVLIVRTRRVS